MTIALGILARNGVVIAADREETVGSLAKYEENKIRGAFHFSNDGKHRHLLLAGAGWGDYVDAFAETIKDDELLKDSRFDKKPKVVLEEALERFYARKVIPFGGYQSHERPDFQVVVGCICGGKSHLFVSTYNVLKSVERFAAIGSGALVARPIVHRFVPPNIGTRSVSIKEAVVIAAHAVREAKDAVPGVGKDTDVLAMFDNGGLSRTVPPTQDPLDAALKQYSTEVEPMVVRAIIGTRDPEKALAEIKRLRAIVQDVLGDTFTEPPSGKKSTQ
jgi:hypothetical protein